MLRPDLMGFEMEQRLENTTVSLVRPKALILQDNMTARTEWPLLPIEQIADINPRADKSAIPDNLPVSFVPMPAVGAGDGSIHVNETRPAGDVKKGFTPFMEGDVLFAKITPCMENGKMAVVPKLVNGYGFGSTEFHVLRPKPGVDAKYLYYYVSSQSFRSEAERHMTGAVGQRRVSTSYLKECTIPLAPLNQQKRIVAEIEKQFSRLDEAIASLKRVKANLKRYKAAVLKAAVEGRLVETEAELASREGRGYETGKQLLQRILETRRRQWKGKGKYKEPSAPDATNLPELPEGWVWTIIGQLGAVKGGKRLPAGHTYAETQTLYPYIRVTDFEEFGIRTSDLQYLRDETRQEIERYTITADDVYISIAGTIGLVGQVPEHLSGANLTENAAKITELCHIEPRHLIYWLASPKGTEYIAQSTIATTQAKLALFRIEQIPVPFPPFAEQHRIVAEVDRRLSLFGEVETQVDANLKRAERLRQAILQESFHKGVRSESDR